MAKDYPSVPRNALPPTATATASAWSSSRAAWRHLLRCHPHPLADPLAPRRPLSRQPRRSSRRPHPGRRNALSTAHREFAEEVGIALAPTELVFLRTATAPIHRALCHAVFLPLHRLYHWRNRIQRRGGGLRRSRPRRFRRLSLQTESRRSRARPATRRHQTKRGHGKLRPQPSPAYSEPIMDAIRRSASAIRVYLDTEQIDATIWPPATG